MKIGTQILSLYDLYNPTFTNSVKIFYRFDNEMLKVGYRLQNSILHTTTKNSGRG